MQPHLALTDRAAIARAYWLAAQRQRAAGLLQAAQFCELAAERAAEEVEQP